MAFGASLGCGSGDVNTNINLGKGKGRSGVRRNTTFLNENFIKNPFLLSNYFQNLQKSLHNATT